MASSLDATIFGRSLNVAITLNQINAPISIAILKKLPRLRLTSTTFPNLYRASAQLSAWEKVHPPPVNGMKKRLNVSRKHKNFVLCIVVANASTKEAVSGYSA